MGEDKREGGGGGGEERGLIERERECSVREGEELCYALVQQAYHGIRNYPGVCLPPPITIITLWHRTNAVTMSNGGRGRLLL